MGAKMQTPKNPWCFKQNPPKSLDQHYNPKKSHAEFLSHKNFQKALNDVTRKIETYLVMECLCLFMFITPSGVNTFFTSGSLFQVFRSLRQRQKDVSRKKKKTRGWGRGYFFLALFLCTALHYPNAWNRLHIWWSL